MTGKSVHIYSPAKVFENTTIQAQLRLDPSKKLLVAFTSSLDEISASRLYLKALGMSHSMVTNRSLIRSSG